MKLWVLIPRGGKVFIVAAADDAAGNIGVLLLPRQHTGTPSLWISTTATKNPSSEWQMVWWKGCE